MQVVDCTPHPWPLKIVGSKLNIGMWGNRGRLMTQGVSARDCVLQVSADGNVGILWKSEIPFSLKPGDRMTKKCCVGGFGDLSFSNIFVDDDPHGVVSVLSRV